MSQGEANTAVERIASGFTSTTDIEQTSLNGRYVPLADTALPPDDLADVGSMTSCQRDVPRVRYGLCSPTFP
jgi:hypothetical protein